MNVLLFKSQVPTHLGIRHSLVQLS